MTRTYAGPFKNPTENFFVKRIGNKVQIWVRSERDADGSCKKDRRHTSAPTFEDEGDALDWLDDLRQDFEDDYDQYLEENHDDIVRMEQYENFMNER